MSEKMYKIREMLCTELDKIADKGGLTVESLGLVDKISHAIKSIDTIMAMEEAGYSEDYYNDYDGSSRDYSRNSYARGRGRNARRDSMGRYSRESYDRGSYDRGSYDNSYARRGRRGYSMDEGKDEMLSQLKEMLSTTNDDAERQAIRKCISELED